VHLPAYEDGTDRVYRNVGIQNSDAGELLRRKYNIRNTAKVWNQEPRGIIWARRTKSNQMTFKTMQNCQIQFLGQRLNIQ